MLDSERSTKNVHWFDEGVFFLIKILGKFDKFVIIVWFYRENEEKHL